MNAKTKIKFSIRKVALICSIVVSVFFVLLILGKPFLFPIPARVQFNAPTGVCYGTDTSVVADQAGERLLFLDEEHKLRSIVELGDATEINYASGFAFDGEHFFIAGYKYEKDTDIISAFRILRMDYDGKNPAVLLDYANENGKETNIVLDINAYDGCLYIVRNNLEEGTIIVTEYQIASGRSDDIFVTQIPADYIAKYAPKEKILYVNDYYGRMFKVSVENPEPEQILEDYMVENFLSTQDCNLLWIDSINKNLYMNEQLLLANTNAYYAFSLCEEGVIFDNAADSRLSTFNLETRTVAHSYGADFSVPYLLLSVICTICILYLGILLIILIIRAIRNMYLAKNYVRIKRTGIVAVLIMSAFIFSLMYTNRIIEIEDQNLQKEISMQSHYFAASIDLQLLDDAVYTPDVGKDPDAWQNYLASYDKLEKEYGFFRERMYGNSKNGYMSLYKKLDDKLVLVFESDAVSHIGCQYLYADFESMMYSGEIVRFAKSGYDNYYCMSPITDNGGEIVGAAGYAQNYRLTNESIRSTCIDMIVKLLAVFATIYLILIELIEFFKNRRKRKVIIDKKIHSHPEIVMIRNVSFMIFAIDCMDSIVIVFVAKHLLQTSGIRETAFLLALPSLLAGIGVVIGCFAFNLIANHVQIKRIVLIAALVYILVRVGICVSVLSGYFALFCLLKLMSSLSSPFLHCTIQTMRVKANNESERYYSSKQYSLGKMSGVMMGTLISGFAIQDINQSVILYAISAVLMIPFILLMIRILPKNTIYVAPSGRKNMAINGRKLAFLFDKSILVYFLFAAIPIYLIKGYQGYLFPLYSDTVQMPALYVTTAVVMSRALLFMLSDSIESLLKKVDYWKTMIFGIGLIGIAFLEFSVNSGIIWALIMLVITGATETVIMPATDMVWSRQAKAKGVPLESIAPGMSLMYELLSAFKETMMSVFLLLGSNSACVMLGIFCLVSIMIFMLCTRKKGMAMAET